MFNRIIKKSSLILVSLYGLSACGCGGSDSPATNPSSPTTPTSMTLNEVAGVYEGEIKFGSETVIVDALISASGEVRILTEFDEQLRGTITLSNDSFENVEFASFFPENDSSDGVVLGRLTTNGTISGDFSDTGLTGSSTFDGETASYSMTKYDFSDNAASLSEFSGNYATLFSDTQISFSTDGAIDGLDDDGCVYGGQVSVPDSNTNVYSMSITVDNCGIANGTFEGLATVLPDGYYEEISGKTILFSVDDQAFSLTVLLINI